MDEEGYGTFLNRDSILGMGKAILEIMPGMSDRQILCCIESFYITDMQACVDDYGSPIETRTVLMQLISIFFEDLAAELRTDPPKLIFNGVPEIDRDSATPFGFTDEALQIKKYACSTVVARNSSRHPWVSYLTDRPAPYSPNSPDTTENHLVLDSNTMGNENSSQSEGKSSVTPVEMSKDKLSVDAAPKIEEDGVAPAVSATKVDLNKEKEKLGDHLSASTGAEEALAYHGLSRSVDAPAEEDEAPARSYINPVADRVLEKSDMHYNMLYDITTQMQRDRLELGPEVSDYEVIAKAHAGYNAVDEVEAAALARAAETQLASALAISLRDDLRAAHSQGLPITQIGGLSLSQEDIASLLRRCDEVGNSSSAAKEYVASKATDFKELYVDPITAKNLKTTTSASIAGSGKQQSRKNKAAGAPLSDHADNSLEKLEEDIKAMKAFHSRMGTTPRDFSKDIEEIEKELAELKAHRAKAPGDLVPDSVDGNEGGIRVDPNDYGDGVEHGAKDNREETSPAGTKLKTKSRAEQRRLARERAKGKGKATE